MKSELVELHIPGGHGLAVCRPTAAPARLDARVYTFTTVGGAQR
jgi:hypothetical protein